MLGYVALLLKVWVKLHLVEDWQVTVRGGEDAKLSDIEVGDADVTGFASSREVSEGVEGLGGSKGYYPDFERIWILREGKIYVDKIDLVLAARTRGNRPMYEVEV